MAITASFSSPEELEAILTNLGYDLSTIRPARLPDSDSIDLTQKEITFNGYYMPTKNDPVFNEYLIDSRRRLDKLLADSHDRLDSLLQKYAH